MQGGNSAGKRRRPANAGRVEMQAVLPDDVAGFVQPRGVRDGLRMNITMRVTMARAEMATVTYSTGVMAVSLLVGCEIAQFGRQGRAVGFGSGGQRQQLVAAILRGALRDPA